MTFVDFFTSTIQPDFMQNDPSEHPAGGWDQKPDNSANPKPGGPWNSAVTELSRASNDKNDHYTEQDARVKQKPGFRFIAIDWIDDEKSLRDEGVIYGLAKDDASAKEEAIVSYYEERAIPYQAEIDGLAEELNDQSRLLAQKNAELQDAKARRNAVVLPKLPVHLVLSFLVRLILSLVGLLGLWWLVYYCAQYGPWDWTIALPVSIGIVVVGSLSLWQKYSRFHQASATSKSPGTTPDGSQPQWLGYTMEFAPAVAAALFTVALLSQNSAVNGLLLAATGLFLLVAFVMGTGKLLLGNLIKINILRQKIRHQQAERSRIEEQVLQPLNQEVAALEDAIKALTEQIKATEARKAVMTPNLLARRDALRQQAQTALHIFRSEFEAARQNRRQMTARELARIQQAAFRAEN